MALNCGIVGLPNVGKSTIFSAVTSAPAEAANYPFCTIDPNIGMVAVPDKRLDRIVKLIPPAKVIPATVEFVDIAGLVAGASKGEGLGIVDGIVSDTCREIGGRKLMMISAPVTTGYSGGPVLSADGEFIGMVTGGRDGETAMNYAIPSVTIRKFLASAEKKAGIRL